MSKDKRFSVYIALITGSLIMNSFTPIFAIENMNVASEKSEQIKKEALLEEENEFNESSQNEIQTEGELNKPLEESEQESSEQKESELVSDKVDSAEQKQEEAVSTEKEITEKNEPLPVVEESIEESIVEDSSSAEELVEEDIHLDEFPELEEYDRQETFDLAMQMMEEDQLSKQGISMYGRFSNVGYIDRFLETIIPQAIEDSVQSRILPSITIAQAALESAWGQSGLAINANNLFGIKSSNDWKGQVYNIKTDEFSPAVYDKNGKLIQASYWYTVVAAFRKYESWLGSLRDHGDFFTSTEWRKNNYRFVIGERNYKKAAQALLSAGYATDPGYANKLINIVDTYNLSKYDQLPVISSDYYVQNKGWNNKKGNTVTIGTIGAGLQLQDMKFSLPEYQGVGITYSAFINNLGWTGSITDGKSTGNAGKGNYMEGFKMSLNGENAKNFDILYRVHSQSFGWSGWAKNGQPAGRKGYGKRIEAIEAKVVWKGEIVGDSPSSCYQEYTAPHVVYSTHVQSQGWKDNVQDGVTSGTVGIKKRLEAITISMNDTPYSGSINYQTHVQSHGWKQTVSNGAMSGTSGQNKRLEAIKIGLSGEMAAHFDIYYRTHIQTYGWTGWAKNGAASGSEGLAKRLEAIEIILVPKGKNAPGSTNNSFYK